MRTLFYALLLTISLSASSVFADYRDLYREGKYSEALAALEQSPEAAQKSYAYFYNRGIIHHSLNQDALAVAYLSKASALDPSANEVAGPLRDSTANLAKFLGVSRLDGTSYPFETLGEWLPLDPLFIGFGVLAVLSWLGFFFIPSKRGAFAKTGFLFVLFAAGFGFWSLWNDQHPVVIMTQARLVKSGPGETFLDRGAVDVGMKLRVVGQMTESVPEGSPAARWWKVRFNERRDLGFIPESSGLLLTDESNTPKP